MGAFHSSRTHQRYGRSETLDCICTLLQVLRSRNLCRLPNDQKQAPRHSWGNEESLFVLLSERRIIKTDEWNSKREFIMILSHLDSPRKCSRKERNEPLSENLESFLQKTDSRIQTVQTTQPVRSNSGYKTLSTMEYVNGVDIHGSIYTSQS